MSAYEASPESRSIIYPIETPRIMPYVRGMMTEDGYRLKDEVHITVVNSEFGRTLDDESFGELSAYLASSPAPGYDLHDALYEVDKPKMVDGHELQRRSLVALAMSMAIFRTIQEARYETGLRVPQPFMHATIATKPDTEIARRGIGIASEDEWFDLQPILYEVDWLAGKVRA